jgi:hypothetical protein
VDRHVELLLKRQRLLRRRPRPLNLWAVLDEAALWRPVGNTATMRAQLEHLKKMCWRPNVTVQVTPYNISHRVTTGGPLTLVRFHEEHLPDLIHIEGATTSASRPAEIERLWHTFNTLVTEARQPERTPAMIDTILTACSPGLPARP